MNRKYSLKKTYDIDKLVRNKKSVGNKYYAIYYNRLQGDAKIAFSVSKKVGNAVIRNYEKRVTREIIRPLIEDLNGFEMLIIIKKTVLELDFDNKKDNLLRLLNRIRKEKE